MRNLDEIMKSQEIKQNRQSDVQNPTGDEN